MKHRLLLWVIFTSQCGLRCTGEVFAEDTFSKSCCLFGLMNLPLHSRFLLFTCEALRFVHAHTGIYSLFFTIRMKINFQSAVLYYSTKQRTIVHKYFWGLFTARNYQITAILVITFFLLLWQPYGINIAHPFRDLTLLDARNAGTTWLQFCRGAEEKEEHF